MAIKKEIEQYIGVRFICLQKSIEKNNMMFSRWIYVYIYGNYSEIEGWVREVIQRNVVYFR